MPQSDSLQAVASYVFNEILNNKASLGLTDVFYGDQLKIPRTPTVCVESDTKNRVLSGVPRATTVEISTFILVYHIDITQSNQTTRADAEELTEDIETFLHAATRYTMGGLVIHHMVQSIEPGLARRSGTIFHATRMQDIATSKVLLPSP